MNKHVLEFLRFLGFYREQEIYYIGGSDILPPPLKGQQEQEALCALEMGDEEAKQLLIEHNLRLVVYIARRFENTGVNLEDLISIGTIGLIKAITTYRRDRNIKLATYASRCIENEILMHIRKIAGQKAEISLDEPINMDYDGNEFLEQGGFWMQKQHIFLYPFYYIDYALAQICAFQFFLKARQDRESAWESYLRLCRAGGSRGYFELLEYAGLENPFREGTVEKVMDGVKEAIREFGEKL